VLKKGENEAKEISSLFLHKSQK